MTAGEEILIIRQALYELDTLGLADCDYLERKLTLLACLDKALDMRERELAISIFGDRRIKL